ncbi:MAG: Gfo/Idh/MocA family oxidoreductase [Planctomycetes bacterium]|nr:Gfo/Idh/MocA family oxidoreductase [Planctomycetota bacterium]
MSTQVRLGIVGIGNMGSCHLDNIVAGKIGRLQVTAICDVVADKLKKHPTIAHFGDAGQMIRSGAIDALLICTPHYDHTTIGVDALAQGLHVLVEKPLSVHKADCARLIAAWDKRPKPSQVFAAMFNQRTDPHYIKLRSMIRGGELGEIRRINWIITDWFRTEAYYASGGWRATWKGEGGGVLTNQCPHNLDLMQWMFGMPTKVRAFAKFGAWHGIETEDAVTAYLDYANGASGVFVTTTGEAPGTNRLEVAAERGKIVIEDGKMTFTRNVTPMSEFSRTTTAAFSRPEVWHIDIPVHGHGGQHNEVLQNFTDAILDGKELIAPAQEGIHSVELGNAMILSSLLERTIDLPMDGAVYEQQLKKLIAESKFEKKTAKAAAASAEDFAKSNKK